MTFLTLLLLSKIVGTLFTVGLPLLLLPIETLDRFAGLRSEHGTLYRLYGIAIMALLVGYSGGVFQAQAGQFPSGVVHMGLVSNAGATVILLLSKVPGLVKSSAVFFGLISLGLLAALLYPEVAMQTL